MAFDVCWKCGTDQQGNTNAEFQAEPDDPSVPDPGHETDTVGNPYASPSLLENETVDPQTARCRLKSVKRSVLFVSFACATAATLFLVQFVARIWYLSEYFPDHFAQFWRTFDYLYWRLPLGCICAVNAYFLWRYAREIRRIVTGDASSFDTMLSSQRAVWIAMTLSIATYLTKEFVLFLMLGGVL